MVSPRPLILVLCLVAGLLAPGSLAPSPADALAPVAARTASGPYADQAFRVTNKRRAQHRLVELSRDRCLQRRALDQARKLSLEGHLFHQDLRRVQRLCGVGYTGENVAFGFATGKLTVLAWMHSPDHRANILKKQYRLMGIAAVKRHGVWWVAQVFGTQA